MAKMKDNYNTITNDVAGWAAPFSGVTNMVSNAVNKVKQESQEAQCKYQERVAEIENMFFSTGDPDEKDMQM